MNEHKLKELLARHTTTDMDKLEFVGRVSSEHLFVSVDECAEYLKKTITFTSTDPHENSPFDGTSVNSYKNYPVLVINTIDEAVCSLIYETYHQLNYEDPFFLAHIKDCVDDLLNFIVNIDHRAPYAFIRTNLHTVLMLIDFLASPTYHKEESLYSQLSYAYYFTMKSLYENAKPRDEYFSKLASYYAEKCK